ncbi:MAG: hypothetical protein R3F17_03055 [Planctomycetota bacterium]
MLTLVPFAVSLLIVQASSVLATGNHRQPGLLVNAPRYEVTSLNIACRAVYPNRPGQFSPDGRFFAFGASEGMQGADLNGDGDAVDGSVVHLWDATNASLVNTAVAGFVPNHLPLWSPAPVASNGYFVFKSGEQAQSIDWNGDGLIQDQDVTLNVSLGTGLIQNSGIISSPITQQGIWGCSRDTSGRRHRCEWRRGSGSIPFCGVFDGATGTSTLMRLVDRVYAVSETHYVARWVDHNVPNSWGLLAGRLDQFPVAIRCRRNSRTSDRRRAVGQGIPGTPWPRNPSAET